MTNYTITGVVPVRARLFRDDVIGGVVYASAVCAMGDAIWGKVTATAYLEGLLDIKRDPSNYDIDRNPLTGPYNNDIVGKVTSTARLSGGRYDFVLGEANRLYGDIEQQSMGIITAFGSVQGVISDSSTNLNTITHWGAALPYNYYRVQSANERFAGLRSRLAEISVALAVLMATGAAAPMIALARTLCALIPPPPPNFGVPGLDFSFNFGLFCGDDLFKVNVAKLDFTQQGYLNKIPIRSQFLFMVDSYYRAFMDSVFWPAFETALVLIRELRRLCEDKATSDCLIDVSVNVGTNNILEAVNGNYASFVSANVNLPNILPPGALCSLLATADANVTALIDAMMCAEAKFDAWRQYFIVEG